MWIHFIVSELKLYTFRGLCILFCYEARGLFFLVCGAALDREADVHLCIVAAFTYERIIRECIYICGASSHGESAHKHT